MKIQKSDLELIEFVIINSEYRFHEPKDDIEINIRELFSDYELNIYFGTSEPIEDEDNIFNIFIKIDINNGKDPLPGYSIFCEGVGLFKIPNLKTLEDSVANNLLQISSLSISINSIRSYLMNITNYYPFGKFILPSIDMNQLISSKVQEKEAELNDNQ